MRLLNKTEQRARLENKPAQLAIQELLTGYRSAPHPATGIPPYDAMRDRNVRTKLDYKPREEANDKSTQSQVNERDKKYKMTIKRNAEKQNTRPHRLSVGDYVLLKQNKVNKWTRPYEAHFYIVFKIKGSTVWAKRMTDGRKVCRDATHFKYVGRRRKSTEVRKENQSVRRSGDWRGDALRKAKTGTTNAHGQDSNVEMLLKLIVTKNLNQS